MNEVTLAHDRDGLHETENAHATTFTEARVVLLSEGDSLYVARLRGASDKTPQFFFF